MDSALFQSLFDDYAPRSRFYQPSHRNTEAPVQRATADYPSYYSLRNRQVPVQRQPARSAKVVSIPVGSAGSEPRWSDPVVKIQKAIRGFLVRKNVKTISAVKREVDEIEKRISKKETAELLRTEAKERLEVTETLMSFLLRLDSLKGVDPAVREIRKGVIKKAIALQERVDAFSSAENHQTPGGHEEGADEPDSNSSEEASVSQVEGVGEDDVMDVVKSESEEKKRDELVERLVEENGKMMGLLTELVQRNDTQTRLLGSLSQRVQCLEKALLSERLKRRKKRSAD